MSEVNVDQTLGEITLPLAKRGRKDMHDDDQSLGTCDDIKNLLMALSMKIDSLNDTMSGNDARINTKIDNLETTLSNKIKEVKNDVELRVQKATDEFDQRLQSSMLVTQQLCVEKTTGALKALTERVDEVQAVNESRLDRLERISIEKDLIISGVPLENNDEPIAIVGDICGALNCNLKQGDFVTAFRLTSKRNNPKKTRTVPIVVRTQDDWVKRELLNAYFKKANLNLTDIGFKTPARIYINERLTATNRVIFNRAAEAKKSNLVYRFFTRRGLVHVQRAENVHPSCIVHISELDPLFPLNSNRSPHSFRRNLRDGPPQQSLQSDNNQPATQNQPGLDGNHSHSTVNNQKSPGSTSPGPVPS